MHTHNTNSANLSIDKIKKIILDIKKNMTCSNDIVLYKNVSLLHPNIKEYTKYIRTLKDIRKYANEPSLKSKSDYPNFLIKNTIARFGVGECGELVSLTTTELVKLIGVMGKGTGYISQIIINRSDNYKKNHAFLIYSNSHPLDHELFKKANNSFDCLFDFFKEQANFIIIDPLLGEVFFAPEFTNSEFFNYIKFNKFNNIDTVIPFDSTYLHIINKIEQDVEEAYRYLLEKYSKELASLEFITKNKKQNVSILTKSNFFSSNFDGNVYRVPDKNYPDPKEVAIKKIS